MYKRQGLIYFNDNQPEKAADAYKSVISNYPGSEEAKVALQDLKSVYIELNDINSFAAYAHSLGGNAVSSTHLEEFASDVNPKVSNVDESGNYIYIWDKVAEDLQLSLIHI